MERCRPTHRPRRLTKNLQRRNFDSPNRNSAKDRWIHRKDRNSNWCTVAANLLQPYRILPKRSNARRHLAICLLFAWVLFCVWNPLLPIVLYGVSIHAFFPLGSEGFCPYENSKVLQETTQSMAAGRYT